MNRRQLAAARRRRRARAAWTAATVAALVMVAAMLFTFSRPAVPADATVEIFPTSSPTVTVTVAPSGTTIPMGAAREGDQVVYSTSLDDAGVVCTFISSQPENFSRIDCGAGRVNVRTTSLTASR